MHMADALLSPAVGGAMTAVSAVALGYAVKKISKNGMDEKKIPIMGVMGAFVFAGQMINFTIPATASSGHIGGGVLLAALLGPFPALLTLAAVLLIQCLFFADGGLLAYGCNVFNMGVVACLFAFQYLYKPIVSRKMNAQSILLASVVATVLGLQVGAFCVVLETLLSGVTELPFASFAALMQPIHLAIGLVEGFITAAVLSFVRNARPELLENALQDAKISRSVSTKKVLAIFLVLTALVGGGLSLFASAYPDGLEWSMEGVAGTAELKQGGTVHEAAASAVEVTAFMPDYSFTGDEGSPLGTSAAGLIGSAMTVVLAGGIGLLIHTVKKAQKNPV
ncbi:MAG: energy-coupling factor ABC transporter permease [Synergistaceae bacterium]|jgi:cobalt/nickel transport system permease protein|nr:energy-coupling factor ABC transporter permease [Synergistaceae bacterium]